MSAEEDRSNWTDKDYGDAVLDLLQEVRQELSDRVLDHGNRLEVLEREVAELKENSAKRSAQIAKLHRRMDKLEQVQSNFAERLSNLLCRTDPVGYAKGF